MGIFTEKSTIQPDLIKIFDYQKNCTRTKVGEQKERAARLKENRFSSARLILPVHSRGLPQP